MSPNLKSFIYELLNRTLNMSLPSDSLDEVDFVCVLTPLVSLFPLSNSTYITSLQIDQLTQPRDLVISVVILVFLLLVYEKEKCKMRYIHCTSVRNIEMVCISFYFVFLFLLAIIWKLFIVIFFSTTLCVFVWRSNVFLKNGINIIDILTEIEQIVWNHLVLV